MAAMSNVDIKARREMEQRDQNLCIGDELSCEKVVDIQIAAPEHPEP